MQSQASQRLFLERVAIFRVNLYSFSILIQKLFIYYFNDMLHIEKNLYIRSRLSLRERDNKIQLEINSFL